jgi:hypothetical protein
MKITSASIHQIHSTFHAQSFNSHFKSTQTTIPHNIGSKCGFSYVYYLLLLSIQSLESISVYYYQNQYPQKYS